MRLKSIELSGFKSFAKKTPLEFASAITAIVGPNGSGKSNVAEAFRFVLGEQSMKSMRGRRGEDLIWNGGAGSSRAGLASVRLVFSNPAVGGHRALNLDFDEVSIERVVHRDQGNDYILNGSPVRLRDIAELLSQANIGSSGHHIISQGEADRILSCGSRERREMVEDALGLTAYLYKREEARRKLGKSSENMKEVEAMRRELAPHLRFLESQVKRIQEAQALRDELGDKYLEYLRRESDYIAGSGAELHLRRQEPKREHDELEETISRLRALMESGGAGDASTRELMALEEEGRTSLGRRDALSRDLGRIEGQLAAHERLSRSTSATIPASEARSFAERVLRELEGEGLISRVAALVVLVKEFLRRIAAGFEGKEAQDHSELLRKKDLLEQELTEVSAAQERTQKAMTALRRAIEGERDASRAAERQLFAAMARRSELGTELASLRAHEELLAREQEAFKTELAEAGVLIGARALAYESYEVVFDDEPRARQEERRRKLERMKIKLEELGVGNSQEVLTEHQESVERDRFLARELADLEDSSRKLRELISELTGTLETRFVGGIEKINAEFDALFKLMFGGGSASLSIVKEKKLRKGLPRFDLDGSGLRSNLGELDEDAEDIEIEEGIDIQVSLPHKRIKGLHMLSGGERALTSIALIFAMSQVNPPPFLILDETDAALDEANSRRYGDMIESLAKKSQLILITHNRETMSRAGVLYGVTMGGDGVSKLLSVKFEEALAVAK